MPSTNPRAHRPDRDGHWTCGFLDVRLRHVRIVNPSTTVFSSPTLRIGAFRCPASHELWRRENLIGAGHHLVFPRNAVGIQQADRPPFVTSPNVVVFYNADEVYRRELLDVRGDACEWFAVEQDTLVQIVAEREPAAIDRPERPFRFAIGPCDARSYLRQRLLFEHVTTVPHPDRLFVEEVFLDVVRAVVADVYASQRVPAPRVRAATRRHHRQLANDACELLGRRFAEPLSLDAIAREIHSSPYHLSRIFAEHIGMPVHCFVQRLRLRHALERLPHCRGPLTQLALDLGYSSHSHFSSAFRREFGVPPSCFQGRASAASLLRMSKKLKAG